MAFLGKISLSFFIIIFQSYLWSENAKAVLHSVLHFYGSDADFTVHAQSVCVCLCAYLIKAEVVMS